MREAFFVIIALAIGTMLYALYLALRLRKIARGGKIGRVVGLLIAFISVFTVGYLSGPLFPSLPGEWVMIIAALVFLFGALFVVIVLRIITTLVQQVFEHLGQV